MVETKGPFVDVFAGLLSVVLIVCVAVFFTIPLCLSTVGHGGAWLKHVVAKCAKQLGGALGVAFALYLGSTVTPDFDPGRWKVTPLSVIILASVAIAVLGIVSRGSLLALMEKGLGAAVGVALSSKGILNRGSSRATVEVQLIPAQQIREKNKPEKIRAESLRFHRLIQTLTDLDGRIEFRLIFRDGRGRVLITAVVRGRHDGLDSWLLSAVKAHLPEFRMAPSRDEHESPRYSRSVLLSGVPEMVENPLEPLARYFIENNRDGDYLIVAQRRRYNPLSVVVARRKQRRFAERSGVQRTETALDQTQASKSVRDHLGEVELEESIKKVERVAGGNALDVRVYVTGHAGSPAEAKIIAEGATSVIRGTLSSHRRKTALKVRPVRRHLGGRIIGRPTTLLPAEAVPYFWIPQVAMGTELASSAEFELPPKLEGEIELGKIVTESGETAHLARILLDILTKHIFITGMTGSGKTTSCFNLLMQLYQLGIPFMVIEPVKSEYRTLLTIVPSLQVFTVGDEDAAPFRLNIFEPPEGVKVQTHLENLEAAWNASFVMYAPLPLVVKQVLAETYKVSGWDVSKNKRGRPITLDDFLFQSEKVSRALGYEPNVLMNIEAALRARIVSLTLGGKGAIFNTIASIPVEDILRRPTVIELRNIPNNEEKAFIAALILMNVAEYLENKGKSKQLRHLTLIEEAHRLLPNVSSQKGDPESADPRKRMVEQFANMLAEIRAYGEGLAIVEQIPTKIIPDAIKNTATKIAHRVPAADDREVLAGAMNLTQEQMSVFTALQPGEAIVSLERHPLPIKIKVPNTIDSIGLPVGEIGDDEVRRHMTEFYLRNPLPRASQSKLIADLLLIVESRWFGAKFVDAYNDWRETGKKEHLATLLVEAAKKHSKSEEEVLGYATRILDLAAERYLRLEEEKVEFPRSFMRSVERWMRDARGN